MASLAARGRCQRQRASLAATLALVALAACGGDDERVRLYHTEPLAPSLSQDEVAALDHMGSTLVDSGVNFAVFSASATRVDLLIFEDPESKLPTRQFPMARFGDVWNLYVEGIGRGQHYGYVAWGENWPEHPDWFPGSIHGFVADVDGQGNRFNPNKLLLDPYARAVHRDHDWSIASLASGPARTESTWQAGAKSIVWSSDYVWSETEAAWRAARRDPAFDGHGWNDLIVYEIHPKGFTASPASGVTHPGTYQGIAEMADYLADLGITAVELMPIHEKPLDGGYWGYNNLSFFAPEISYAATPRPLEVIDEFKAMVEALHARDIEVIVDVVYNHSGEGGLWREQIELVDTILDPVSTGQLIDFDPKEVAGLYSFRGLDNASYYALSDDGQTYWNNTGVGNQLRPNNPPVRRLILDSLRFMVQELHVDGFRFDLAPVLGASDVDPNAWDDPARTILQDIADDPVLREHNTRIIAEPWAAGGEYGFRLGAFPSASDGDGAVAWYEWNAYYRDWWRSFVNLDDWSLSSREGASDGGGSLTGSFDLIAPSGRRPYHSVNFVTVHDGFTMYDLVSYDAKQNGCGPLNPVCCDQPASPFCDRDSGENHNRSRNWGQDAEPLKRQLMRNLFVALLISHGTPLLLGGDEWMRTQLGNNNAYSTLADNPFNWMDWGSWQPATERQRMHDFVRQLIAFRKAHGYALAPSDYGESAPFAWKSAGNTDAVDWGSRHVMQHYYDPDVGEEIVVLINMETGPVDFTLPEGRSWRRVVDTQQAFDSDEYVTGSGLPVGQSANISDAGPALEASYTVMPRSIVIAVAEP